MPILINRFTDCDNKKGWGYKSPLKFSPTPLLSFYPFPEAKKIILIGIDYCIRKEDAKKLNVFFFFCPIFWKLILINTFHRFTINLSTVSCTSTASKTYAFSMMGRLVIMVVNKLLLVFTDSLNNDFLCMRFIA